MDGYGREDELEVTLVRKVPRTEEGGAKPSVCEGPLRDRLSNGALPHPCEPVQPIDRGSMKVECPEFDLVQKDPTRSLEATVTVAVSVLGLVGIAKTLEDFRISYKMESG